jgi:hypothetical protein
LYGTGRILPPWQNSAVEKRRCAVPEMRAQLEVALISAVSRVIYSMLLLRLDFLLPVLQQPWPLSPLVTEFRPLPLCSGLTGRVAFMAFQSSRVYDALEL